jgi:hypothetical protein
MVLLRRVPGDPIWRHGPWEATGRNTVRRFSSTCLPLSDHTGRGLPLWQPISFGRFAHQSMDRLHLCHLLNSIELTPPFLSRRQTWMDHRRQGGYRGRSADRLERNRRDRSAPHPDSLGSQPVRDWRSHVAIRHDALSRHRSQKRTERSKGIMPRHNALQFFQLTRTAVTWCASRTAVTGNGLWIAQIGVISFGQKSLGI